MIIYFHVSTTIMLFIIIYLKNLSLACTLLRKEKFLHIFAFLYTKRSRKTHLTVSHFLSVYLSVVFTLEDVFLCTFLTGKWEGRLQWNIFLCYIHAWDSYGLLGTWNCHGLFGNKITAAQNLLKSSYRIMNVILFNFYRDVKLMITVWKLMYLR